jgi:hypothetical protein
MRYNAIFAQIADEKSLNRVSEADLPEPFRRATSEGWLRDEHGAWLLKYFLETYSSSPAAFADVTGYEAAVNGRGVPDIDLTSDGLDRARDLAKRAYAFARVALYRLSRVPGHPLAAAYVSISSLEMDGDEIYTGSITFTTPHEGEPRYVDNVEELTSNAVLMVDISDCIEPLP